MRKRVKPRVAIVAASLDILGGQGVQARSLTEALRRDDYPVTFVPINPAFPHGLRWIRKVRYLRTLTNEAMYLPTLARLASADVIHVFSGSYWSFLLAPVPAMSAGRAMNKRVVLHYHSGEAHDHLSNWGPLVHPWFGLAHEVVVPSDYLRDVFAQHGYSTRVIPNVVDLSAFAYRDRRPLRPLVLSTRNLEPYYRVDLVIEAFARFKAEVPDATLTIAGCGSQESRLRDLARALVGNAVRFMGKVPPEAIPRLYAEHDIFVNASVLDNQPVSVLEAFSAGLPVVTTSTGDIAAMARHGEFALLVSPGDSTALGDAITTAWRAPDDARRRAARARLHVARYTWPAVRERWAAVYAGNTDRDAIPVNA
jgi:glycosyltransferase involved in cell wall biosynthesis